MRMSYVDWINSQTKHLPVQRFKNKTHLPRERKEKPMPRWLFLVPDRAPIVLRAPSRSEARAMAKRQLGLKNGPLPAGTEIRLLRNAVGATATAGA